MGKTSKEELELRQYLGLELLRRQPLLLTNASEFVRECKRHENAVLHRSDSTLHRLFKQLKPMIYAGFKTDPTAVKDFMGGVIAGRFAEEADGARDADILIKLHKRYSDSYGLDETKTEVMSSDKVDHTLKVLVDLRKDVQDGPASRES